jgi:hypothetical protein
MVFYLEFMILIFMMMMMNKQSLFWRYVGVQYMLGGRVGKGRITQYFRKQFIEEIIFVMKP